MPTAADKLAAKLATLTGNEEAREELRALLDEFGVEVIGNLAAAATRASKRLDAADPALACG